MRPVIRGAVQVALKSMAALAPAGRGAVVLIYHRVGERPGAVTIAPDVFRRQIEEVAATGRAATLDDVVDSLARSTPCDSVVVTFDDGTADVVDAALPVLVAHQVPMTLYVATRFVEHGEPFPGGHAAISWSGLAECVSTGLVAIGSHTHSHVLLDRARPADVDVELDTSIKLIEDRLGVTPQHFAYPKALLGSPAAQAAVRQRFRSAAVAGTRPNVAGRTDVHRLSRSPIQRSDGMRWFRRKLHGGMRLEDDVRRLANRVRYRDRVD